MSAPRGALPLGIDLGGTKIHAELLGDDGRALWRQRIPTPAGDYAATVAALASLVTSARTLTGRRGLTVGIGGPGALMADGRLHNANSTCLNGQPLAQDLETAIGQPVRYANDANCLALSEAVDGAGAGHPVVWAVILGTGTGAGLAIDGRVMTGPNRLCGEWGHNPLPWMDDAERAVAQAEPCWCGQPGCTETFVSGPGMARDHLRHGGEPLAAIDIAARAAAGDAACRSTLDRHADRLARALASVVNLLDPDVVVLAGGLSLIPGLVPQVLERWERWIFRGAYAGPLLTRLVTARHGDASGVRGAAWLWREPARRSAG